MYIILKMLKTGSDIGKIIKQQRISIPLTLCELSNDSGVSQSHIGRIERGERLPSARVLRKIAKPLGFKEEELFMLAGFLSGSSNDQENSDSNTYRNSKIDPFVASVLAHEPAEIQRTVIGILSLLKTITKVNNNKVT